MRRAAAAAIWAAGALFLAAQTPVPTPVPPGAPIESPGQALLEQEESALAGRAYTYDPAGRRDPFRSLLVRSDQRGGAQRPPGIAGLSIDDIVLHGIWKTRSGHIAQVRGTDNKSYLLRAGDLLYDGEVIRVGPNEVTFRQNLNDPQSVKPFRDVTKQLNATVRP
jgi:type IV pilus assembly protein PilP